jgi:hypothetical protein
MTRRASILAYCLIIALVLLGLQSWSIAVGRVEQHVISAIEQRTGLVVTARERAEIAFCRCRASACPTRPSSSATACCPVRPCASGRACACCRCWPAISPSTAST